MAMVRRMRGPRPTSIYVYVSVPHDALVVLHMWRIISSFATQQEGMGREGDRTWLHGDGVRAEKRSSGESRSRGGAHQRRESGFAK